MPFFFPCLVFFEPSDESGMLCSDTPLAERTNSLAERTTVGLHCQVESVIWNETNLSWHHKYPTVDMTLFDPVVKNSTVHFAYMGISSSGEYTCMAEYDGQVVLQYTVVLNVFCKCHDQVHDFLWMAPKFENTPGGGGGGVKVARNEVNCPSMSYFLVYGQNSYGRCVVLPKTKLRWVFCKPHSDLVLCQSFIF